MGRPLDYSLGKGVYEMRKILFWIILIFSSTILGAQELTLHSSDFSKELYSGNYIQLFTTNESSIYTQEQESNKYNLYFKNTEDLKFKIYANSYLSLKIQNSNGSTLKNLYDILPVGPSSKKTPHIDDWSTSPRTYRGVYENVEIWYPLKCTNKLMETPMGYLSLSENSDNTIAYRFYEYTYINSLSSPGGPTTTPARDMAYETKLSLGSLESTFTGNNPVLVINDKGHSSVSFLLNKDTTAPTGINLNTISVDTNLDNAKYILIDNDNKSIIYNTPASGSLPHISVSMNPDDIIETGSGFKGYRINNFGVATQDSFQLYPSSLGNRLDLRLSDNVGNISDEIITYNISKDNIAPVPNFHMEKMNIVQTDDGTWQICLTVGSTAENTVEVSDSGAGFLESSFQADLITESETIKGVFTKDINGNWCVNIPTNGTGENYKIRINTLEDQVHNAMDTYTDSSIFSLPQFPLVDQINSGFSTSNSSEYHLFLTIKSINNLKGSLTLLLGSEVKELGNISDLNWTERNGSYHAEKTISLTSSTLPSHTSFTASLLYSNNDFTLENAVIESWTEDIPDQPPQASSIILKSNGMPLPLEEVVPIPFSGRSLSDVLSQESINRELYFKEKSTFFNTAAIIDPDGDIYTQEIKIVGEYYYAILKASYILDEKNIPLESYVLPIRFRPDNAPPQIEGFQPQFKNDEQNMIPCPKYSGISYYKKNPDQIQIEGLLDTSGLALAKLFNAENQLLGDLTINEDILTIPDDLTLEGGPYQLHLYDQAFNLLETSLPLIIDKQPPNPLNDEAFYLSTVADEGTAEILIRYTQGSSSYEIGLDYSYLLTAKNPLEHWSLNIDSFETPDFPPEYLEVIQDTENNCFRITCNTNTPSNKPVTLNLHIKDLSGNILDQEVVFYTPAIVTENDISISGIAPNESEYTNWSDDLKHHITLERVNRNWESLIIEVSEDEETWLPLGNSPWNGDTDWIDRNLIPHQERIYRLIPVNASGAQNRDSIFVPKTDGEYITVGNYRPYVNIDSSDLLYQNSTAYIGPKSQIEIEIADRDEDGLTTVFYLNEEQKDNLKLTDGILDPNLLTPLLSDAQPYLLSVKVLDTWGVDDSGSTPITESIHFTYDDKCPDSDFSLVYSNPQFSWSCNQSNFTINDVGVGTGSVIFIVDEDNVNIETLNLYYEDEQNLDKDYTIELPEGSYTLRAVVTDRLGNVSNAPVFIGKVQNDLTPPQLLSASPVKDTPGSWNIGIPQVPVDILWQDNLSGIARVEYQYFIDDEILIEGYKCPVNPSDSIEGINLFPGIAALEEGIEYNLRIRLVDQGGNSDEWVELSDTVCFGFTSPELKLETWDLVQINGIYCSDQNTIPLPSFQTSSNNNIIYRLLDAQGNFIKSVGSEFSLNIDGSYMLQVEVLNEFGHTSYIEIPFIQDTRAPSNLTIQWQQGQPDTLHPGERTVLSLSGEDSGCGIKSYQIIIPGQNVTLMVPSGGSKHILFDFPADIIQGVHTLEIRAQDFLGHISEPLIEPVTIENTGEYILFRQPAYLGLEQILSLGWDYHGSLEISHYEIQLLGLREDGSSILYEQDSFQNHLTISAEDLHNLDSYIALKVLVRPITSGGERRSIFSSSKIYLDGDAPVLHMNSPTIIHPESLPVSWNIDEASPLKSVTLQLERIYEEEGITQYSLMDSWVWQEDGRNQDFDLIPFLANELPDELTNLRLRLSVCDLAENRNEVLSSPIVIDRTSAPSFTVQDQGEFLNPDKNALTFNWFWASSDDEAGETGFLYQLSNTGIIDETAWNNTTAQETRDREISFTDLSEMSFPDNSQWFLLLRRENAQGTERTLFSDGIIIDRSKPEIVSVNLLSSAEEPFEDKFFTTQEDINIKVEARDNQSGIKTYQYNAGTWEGGAFHSLEDEKTTDKSLIETQLILPENAGSLLSYQIHCSNGAEERSLPSYSPSIMYNPTTPEIRNVILSNGESNLEVQWSVHTMAPIAAQNIRLYKKVGNNKVLVSELPITSGSRFYSYDKNNLQDGIYSVVIEMKDYANHIVNGESPLCVLDRQGPNLSWVNLPYYIHNTLNLNLQANEEIEQIYISLKWPGGEIYRRDLHLSASMSNWHESLDLTTMSSWDLLKNQESAELILSVSARDKQGNLSSLMQDHLIFDNSKPALQEFNFTEFLWEEKNISNPRLVPSSDVVNGINLKADSAISPITGYRWAISDSPEFEIQDWIGYRALENPQFQINLQNLSLDGFNFSHGEQFYIALAVQNQAGIYSETIWSPLLKASLRNPEFRLECLAESPSVNASIYTLGPAQVTLTPLNREYPVLKSSARLISPENEVLSEITAEDSLHDFNGLLDLETYDSFTSKIVFDKTLQGQWTLEVTLVDPFGRSSTQSIGFSANHGPLMDIPQNLACTPGTPIILPYQDWLLDSQGIASVQLFHKYEEEEIFLMENLYQENTPWSLTLSQTNGFVTGNSYNFILKAKDNLGAESQTEFKIDFQNSSQGILVEDELWEGTHYLTGPLTIAEDIKLTIADGTQVLTRSGPIYGYDQELIIDDNATIILRGNVTFSTDGEYPGALWKGIRFAGPETQDIPVDKPAPIVISGLQVYNALRGITVEPGLSLNFINTTLQNNVIGLHLLSSWVQVSQCTFSGNLHYGIKEEVEISPILNNNIFANNGYDIYDIQIITPSQGVTE